MNKDIIHCLKEVRVIVKYYPSAPLTVAFLVLPLAHGTIASAGKQPEIGDCGGSDHYSRAAGSFQNQIHRFQGAGQGPYGRNEKCAARPKEGSRAHTQ